MAPPNKTKPKRPWQEIAKEAQDHRDASIAEVGLCTVPTTGIEYPESAEDLNTIASNFLTPGDISITNTSPEMLITQLSNGSLTATDVTKAFLRRAVVAQKVVCSIRNSSRTF